MRGGQVDPGHQLGQLFLRRGDLAGFVARHAIGFGQVAAQVPDPLAVRCRMAGHGNPRLGTAAQAMGVERLQCRRLDHDHVQRAALHGWLLKAQRGEQFRGAAARTEDDPLGANVPLIDAQADQFISLAQRLDSLTGQQAVAREFRQPGDQARHVQHQFAETIDLALEPRMLQRRRQLTALDLADSRAHGLAGEEAGEVAGQGTGRPEIVGVGQ